MMEMGTGEEEAEEGAANGRVIQIGQWQFKMVSTLRASLSGTFLQTLPDLVTPLKGHSLFPRSCPPTRSALLESFGY